MLWGSQFTEHIVLFLSETDSTSYITYSIKLLNSYDCDAYYIGTAFDNAFYDNSNITFELSSNLVIGMILAPGESIEFDITFKYKNGISPSSNINKLNSYISFNFSTLPSDYVVLEYIESTGTQYIMTGVTGNARWEFDIQFTDTTTRQLMGYGGASSEYWGVQTSGRYGLHTQWTHMQTQAGGRDIVVHNFGENGEYYVLNGGKDPSGYTNEWNTPENTITNFGPIYLINI